MKVRKLLNVFEKILFLITLSMVDSVYPMSSNNLKQHDKNLKFHKTCKIYGEVRDRQGAVLPGTFVVFKGSNIVKNVKTNYSGEYSLEVSKGIYEIIPQLDFNWESYKRAKVNISCENDMLVNIYSFPKVISLDNHYDKYKIHFLSGPSVINKELNIVIVSLNREIVGDNIIYTDAIFTYNNYTVSANKIIQNVKQGYIIAEGDVWIENGKERKDSEKITLRFYGDEVGIEF